MGTIETERAERVLISGASFAGLTTAIWMRRLGYGVTVVELASDLRKGGTPVDLHEDVLAIADRLGVLPAIRAKALPPRAMEFDRNDGGPVWRKEAEPAADSGVAAEYEIHRDDLLAILLAELDEDVEMVFGDSVTDLADVPDGVRASFQHGPARDFAMVLGCDGNHSVVRRLRFGPESEYSHFLHNYFSVAVVDGGTFIPWSTTRIQNTPGRTLMLNSYIDATDVVLAFHADEEIAYDHHDTGAQKRILQERFRDAGEPIAGLVERAVTADDFYFDKLSQIRMPHWTSGRVALIGDAGYCPSPAAGMGGSVAILGATAFHDALSDSDGDVERAFAEYERRFRPVIESIQERTETIGVPMIFPDTAEAIAARDDRLFGVGGESASSAPDAKQEA